MLSSPIKIYDLDHWDDLEDIYDSPPEPTLYECQNQHGHFDWSGNLRSDLPDSCKQTLGILISHKDGK